MLKIFVWEVRNKKGISLRDLSKKSGVSYQEINFIENGIKMPRLDTLYKLAIGLDVRISELYDSENK